MKSGVIRLPFTSDLYDKEVEVIIVPKMKSANLKTNRASDFVNRWAGFLSDSDVDKSKYNYLSEKYK